MLYIINCSNYLNIIFVVKLCLCEQSSPTSQLTPVNPRSQIQEYSLVLSDKLGMQRPFTHGSIESQMLGRSSRCPCKYGLLIVIITSWIVMVYS